MRAAALLLLVGACTGTIGEDGNEAAGGSEAEQMFASTVAPLLRSHCASCHEGAGSGPAFLGAAGGDDDYSALLANARVVGGFQASSALLLTKGSHAGVSWWTAEQQSTITAWLSAEAVGRGPGGVTDIMAAWAGCMTVADWNESRMGEWANKRTDQGATCGGCHADGEYGFHANPTSDIMFAQQRTQVGITSFFQVSAAGAKPSVAPSVDKLRSKCSGANLHPACAVDDQYVEYLQRFHKLTLARMEAGICGQPGYKNLTDPL
jgi:cytochrome c553